MDIPIVKPINEINYEFKQSKYSNVPKMPFRALIFGPSGSGKSVLLVSLILDIYRNVFQRVYMFSPSVNHDSIWLPVKKYVKDELKVNEYMFSPSVNHDSIWLPVKKYVKDELKVNEDKEKCFFEEYKGEDLMKIIDTQTKVTKCLKDNKEKKLYNILVILDDIADAPEIARHNKLLQSLYVRGRHAGISVITASQKAFILHPVIRVNATQLFIFRLRNKKELDSIIEELGALADPKVLNLSNIRPR